MIGSGIGLDISLLPTSGIGQSVLQPTIGGEVSVATTANARALSAGGSQVVDIFLWTYGASYVLKKAAEMNFTCVVTPAQIDIKIDETLLDKAKAEGIGIAFDIRQVAENWINPEWQQKFTEWLSSVKDHAALKYLLVYPDINRDSKYLVTASQYSTVSNIQAMGLENYINVKAPGVKTMTTHAASIVTSTDALSKAKFLGKMDVEGIAAYANWRGNGDDGNTTLATCISTIQGYAALFANLPMTTNLCLWLQAFESMRITNTFPSYDDWVTLWQAAQAVSQRFNRIGFMGWQLAGKNVSGIGNSQTLQNLVALFNATVRGVPYISPRIAIVKSGATFPFTSATPNVVWALNNAPSGTIISQTGVISAGGIGGTCEVRIYPQDTLITPGQPLPDGYLAKAALYVDVGE